MGQLTITSPWRLDTRSKGDSHSQGSASGGKLKGVTTCFRQVTKQVRPGCHFHRSGTLLPAPYSLRWRRLAAGVAAVLALEAGAGTFTGQAAGL